MDKRVNINDRIICLLFSIIPVVDTANGYLIRNDGNSVGIVYKLILCIYLFVACFIRGKIKKRHLKTLVFSCCYVLLTFVCNYILSTYDTNKTDFLIKLLFNVSLYVLLSQALENRLVYSKTLHEILNNSAWLFSACFLVPYFLGIGEHTYSGDLGYKGFFYSQNEISLVIIVLFFFSLYKLEYKLKALDLLQMAMLLLCALLLNTKSTILGCGIGLVHWLWNIVSKQKIGYKIAAAVILVIGIYLFSDTIVRTISTTITRVTALNNNYQGKSFAALISGRNYKYEIAVKEFLQKNTVLKLFIGNGFWSEALVEMDLVDAFFYLGTIGALAIVIYLFRIVKSIANNIRYDRTRLRFIETVIILLFTFITGHVVFYATSGCFFVLTLCYNEFYLQNNLLFAYKSKGLLSNVKAAKYNS